MEKELKYMILWLADNLELLKQINNGTEVNGKNLKGKIDLIYIDPPFNSKRNYNMVFNNEQATEEAFKDIWSNVNYLDELDEIHSINPNLHSFLKMLETTGLPKSYLSYLTAMGIRIWYMREIMSDTGSFYLHCDSTCSHYLKILLDYIFGMGNFRNEIVWHKYNGVKNNAKGKFTTATDSIFLYTKNETYTFNVQYQPMAETYIKNEYKYIDEDGRKYALLRGRMYQKTGQAKKKYLDENPGTPLTSFWEKINLNTSSAERLGYPTQKPQALLERIIKASSNEGDIVADFYLGGGTTAAVAKIHGRQFIGCDINFRAIQITKKRLEALGCELKKDLIINGIPNNAAQLKAMVDENILGTSKNSKFDLEEVTIKYYLKNVVGNKVKVGDNSIDGTFGFEFNGEKMKGLVQVTAGSNKNHLKSFCSEIGKGTGQLGVYITFKENITDGFIKEVKGYGKLGNVDKIQILTFEDLIDNRKNFDLPINVKDGEISLY